MLTDPLNSNPCEYLFKHSGDLQYVVINILIRYNSQILDHTSSAHSIFMFLYIEGLFII